ncbi:MAG: hypothetical protein ACRDIY_24155, partial [Chloroflexota bacterium]
VGNGNLIDSRKIRERSNLTPPRHAMKELANAADLRRSTEPTAFRGGKQHGGAPKKDGGSPIGEDPSVLRGELTEDRPGRGLFRQRRSLSRLQSVAS